LPCGKLAVRKSTSFEWTLPSPSIASRIKKSHPEVASFIGATRTLRTS
jgi:hypothetical protein